MIVRSEEVTQVVDGREQARFVKELVHVAGPQPLAIVRKRLPDAALPPGGSRGAVLLTHGFGQNRYAWHLSGRSFANYLAREGFDVFNVDFRGQGRSRALGSTGARCVDDYIREDLPAAVAEARALSGRDRVFIAGHSLGGLVAYAAAPQLRDALAGLVTLGSPYHFARGSVALRAIARLLGALPRGAIDGSPGALPIRAVGRWLLVQRALWDTPLLPLPLRAWAPGAIEPHLLEEYLRRSFDTATVGTLVQLARLALDGRFASRDGLEDYGTAFESCDLPLLVVAGARDLLAPPVAVRPAYDRSRATDKSYRVVPLGHADLLLGREATRTSWPLVARWLCERAAQATRQVAVAAAAAPAT